MMAARACPGAKEQMFPYSKEVKEHAKNASFGYSRFCIDVPAQKGIKVDWWLWIEANDKSKYSKIQDLYPQYS